MQVVVRKPRNWFWQSPKFEVTPFKLNQLLTDENEFESVKTSQRPLTTYNKKNDFDLHGKIGGKLQTLLNAEISASDVVTVDAKFGEVVKEEMDEPGMLEAMAARKLDLSHQFVKRIQSDGKLVLCVIVGSAQLAKEGSVHITTDITAGESASVPAAGDDAEDANVENKSDKTLTIPASTPVAYNLCQLYVHADGSIEMVVDVESKGGFETTEAQPNESDFLDGIEQDYSLELQFRSILTSAPDERDHLREAIRNLCMKPRDILHINHHLKSAMNLSIIGGEAAKSGKLCIVGDKDAALYILEKAGLTVEADDTVMYPSSLNKLGLCIAALFAALMELDDDETVALCNIDKHEKAIQYLIASTLEEAPLKANDPILGSLFNEPSGSRAFVESLGFRIEDTEVSTEDTSRQELEGAHRAVYVLHYNGEAGEDGSWGCQIL